jgi:hypothetical protein
METMKALAWSALVACVSLGTTLTVAAQTPVGALAVDERQGDQYGWAVDYETSAAAQARALQECGADCSVVLTFGRCAAYAADQDADSTAVGWAESFDSSAGARQAALSECSSRGGGSGCTVRVWGCNGPVVEEGLGLNQAARQQVQQGRQAAGFAPGGADGLFSPRTRAAIRRWQSARGVRSTGHLDGQQVEALRSRGGSAPPASGGATAADGGLQLAFWQSVQNSTNPVEFEAYLRRFPNGVFSELAQARLAALRGSAGDATTAARPGAGTSPAFGAAGAEPRRSSDAVFRPDQVCTDQAGAPCWMEISQRPGCYVWNPFPAADETVTWTGACVVGFAQGTGTKTWIVSGTVTET